MREMHPAWFLTVTPFNGNICGVSNTSFKTLLLCSRRSVLPVGISTHARIHDPSRWAAGIVRRRWCVRTDNDFIVIWARSTYRQATLVLFGNSLLLHWHSFLLLLHRFRLKIALKLTCVSRIATDRFGRRAFAVVSSALERVADCYTSTLDCFKRAL